MYDMIWRLLLLSLVRYDLVALSIDLLYDINLRATHTMIPSTRGVEIHISLVSSATDSIWQCVVVFKTVTVPTSDLKSEFLCQSSSSCAEPTDSPRTTLYAWEISHTLITTYHPYSHSPSALTKYLKYKLRLQRAKRLGRSLPTQVKSSIQLECNRKTELATRPWQFLLRLSCCWTVGKSGKGVITYYNDIIYTIL